MDERPPRDESCLFCRIVEAREHSWIVWQDAEHLAFLTPYPNTPGFTVLATRGHLSSYLFQLDDEAYEAMLRAARSVGRVLDRALGTQRTALIIEGMGVNHAHAKLIPLHGLDAEWKPALAKERAFSPTYAGYVTSLDGPRALDAELDRVAVAIRAAASSMAAPG